MNAAPLPMPQVIILAAGFSSRLGRPKALARVRGVSLLRKTLALVSRVSAASIIVVVPPRAGRYQIEARGFDALFALNSHRARGLSSSVQCGIATARYSSAVLLLPVDLPAVQPRDLARLISRWRANRRRLVARRLAQPGNISTAAVPLILPRWLYRRALTVRGDIGLRALAQQLPLSQTALVDLPAAALDVDTSQDLCAARHFRGRRN